LNGQFIASMTLAAETY